MPNLRYASAKSSSIESKQLTTKWLPGHADPCTARGQQVKDAESEIEATKSLAKKSQNTLLRLQFDLAFARVLLLSGRPEMSRQQSAKVLKRRATSIRGPSSKPVSSGRIGEENWTRRGRAKRIGCVENSVRSKGFGLIARKAAAAR